MASIPSVLPGRIIVNGENPFIWLSETEGGPRTTEASVWTITYSEKGPGHALFIKSELTDNQWRIYTDNPEMTRWMQSTVQGMLVPETADQSIPVIEAEFSHLGDVKASWTQVIKSKEDLVVMTWNNMKHPILVQDEEISVPGRKYGVNAVMIPAEQAYLTLNGKLASGQIWPMDMNGTPFSTGALAFSENWRAEK
ncbi:hypothetical protein [Aureibacter tunicatorum]|uniref:Uncharacterized protein n=1 Tax=Aureibacter tunicatorum TaxID=866807 RepID=A0AAE3XQZ6_9BACT|nr:hypothetical protein [Aureibacter tunicatorum]MDR6240443.1 hypothetical protein [Aureibacter tunicatorum]BDD05678.1 hypothetical protein AUTU_31610 [Aureibacter tunicatorum]